MATQAGRSASKKRALRPAKTQKTENSYLHVSELNRPASKGTKLVLQVIRAIINQLKVRGNSMYRVTKNPRSKGVLATGRDSVPTFAGRDSIPTLRAEAHFGGQSSWVIPK